MLSVCTHARSQSFSPLVNGHVNNAAHCARLQRGAASSHRHCSYYFIHSLLHNTQDFMIHLVQVWAV